MGRGGGHFTPEMLGTAELVEEVQTGSSKLVKVGNFLEFPTDRMFDDSEN